LNGGTDDFLREDGDLEIFEVFVLLVKNKLKILLNTS
jgi:hypothetical protein